MFNELSLEGVAMIGMVRRTQSVPVVLVSGPEDAECTSEQTTDQEHVETRPVEGECDTHNEPVMEEGVDGNKGTMCSGVCVCVCVCVLEGFTRQRMQCTLFLPPLLM